jgi:hypothetical protein
MYATRQVREVYATTASLLYCNVNSKTPARSNAEAAGEILGSMDG